MTRSPSEFPGMTRPLWAAGFVFAVLACAGSLAAALLPAAWRVAAGAAAGAAALALLLVLAALWRRAGAAARAAARQRAEGERLQADLAASAADVQRREDQVRAHLTARSAALAEAVDDLVQARLPAVLNGSEPPAADGAAAAGDAGALSDRVLDAMADTAAGLRAQLADQQESARLAVVALARRVQTSAHRIQEEATRMAEAHSADPDVLATSMRLDHAAAQQARHAQSVAVLCGEWPGQQWPEPLALVDVVRAAAGRIVPYQRVTVAGDPDAGAAARLVEPLIHLVAELLANATQSSPPNTQVTVSVRVVQHGAVIEVDDGGVGLPEHRLEQVREIAAGRRLTGLAGLGEIPQTGLAVVGQYARRHGLRIDLMHSPYGGIRAVVLVPARMVEILEPAGVIPAGRRGAAPAGTPSPAPGRPAAAPAGPATAQSGRQAAKPAPATTAPTAGEAAPASGAVTAGAGPGAEAGPGGAAGPGGTAVTAGQPGAADKTAPAGQPGRGEPGTRTARRPAASRRSGRTPVPAEGAAGSGARPPLPQRRSRRSETGPGERPAAAALPGEPAPPPPAQPTPEQAGNWLGAYLGGSTAGGAGQAAGGGAATGGQASNGKRGHGGQRSDG